MGLPASKLRRVNEWPQPQLVFSCGFMNLKPCCISVCSHSSAVPLEVDEALRVDDDAHGASVLAV